MPRTQFALLPFQRNLQFRNHPLLSSIRHDNLPKYWKDVNRLLGKPVYSKLDVFLENFQISPRESSIHRLQHLQHLPTWDCDDILWCELSCEVIFNDTLWYFMIYHMMTQRWWWQFHCKAILSLAAAVSTSIFPARKIRRHWISNNWELEDFQVSHYLKQKRFET